MEAWGLEILAAICLSMGYALAYHVSKHLLLPAILGGMLSWLSYSITLELGGSMVFACFLGAALVAIWSEIFARLRKAPSTIFMIIGVLPLVPGSLIYLTMLAVVEQRFDEAVSLAFETGAVSLTLALSIFICSSIARFILQRQNQTSNVKIL